MPRLATSTAVTRTATVGSAESSGEGGQTRSCRSAAARPGRVRKKPPASPPLPASGPDRDSRQRAAVSQRGPALPGTCQLAVTRGWSCSPAPTAGRSTATGIPSSRRWSAGPIPDRNSSCGEPIAPAARITSAVAVAAAPARPGGTRPQWRGPGRVGLGLPAFRLRRSGSAGRWPVAGSRRPPTSAARRTG